MSGQWRVGFGGPFALDYSTLFARMERLRLSDDDWEQRFQDLRALEAAALETINGKSTKR